jgi:hypothetical protein
MIITYSSRNDVDATMNISIAAMGRRRSGNDRLLFFLDDVLVVDGPAAIKEGADADDYECKDDRVCS